MLAWSNAFRQSSHAETLVKIVVCDDGLIIRIGGLRASCDFCELRLPQDPRFSTARRARIDRSMAIEQNANMFKRGDPKPTGQTWRQMTLGKLMRAV